MSKPMKVTVTLTVELPDPDLWTLAFGIEGATEIRQDVKRYVGGLVQQSEVLSGEAEATVTWR